jgi:hypothetical protein
MIGMTDDELMERSEWIKLLILCGGFLAIYLLPIGSPSVESALREGVRLTQWYAREHVILCLLPALAIDGVVKSSGRVLTPEEVGAFLA